MGTPAFRSAVPGAGACSVQETSARTVPGPGAYSLVRWRHDVAAASSSAFVSRVPRDFCDAPTTDAPSPTHYQRLATWGTSGRAHAMGPRAQSRLVQQYCGVAVRRSWQRSAPSIPDRSWHGLNAWQSASSERQGSAHGPGAGEYSPRFDCVQRRPVSVDFGKRPGRETRLERGAERRAARHFDAGLTVQPSTVAIAHAVPTFNRQARSHTRRDPALDDRGGRAERRDEARRAPARVLYDLRGKLSRPLPPFPRSRAAGG